MKKIPQTSLVQSWWQIYPNPLEYLLEQQYKLGDIFYLNLGTIKILVLAHPEYANYVLNKKWRSFDKSGQIYDALRLLAGNGLVGTNDYNFWLQRRRLIQPYFNHTYLPHFAKIMLHSIDEVLQKINQPQIDLKDVFGQITMNVIVKTLFGSGIDQVKEDYLRHEASFAFDHMMISIIGSALPLPGRRRFERFVISLDNYIDNVIQRRKDNSEPVLLDMLINYVDDDGNKLSRNDIRDEILTFFLAGYETTSAALQWAMYYILSHKNNSIKNKVILEVDQVVGQRNPGYEDISNLVLLNNVFKEGMRLKPPGFWIPRRAVKSENIDGYNVPEGTLIAVMIHLIHHHKHFWDNPFVFNPDRFLGETKHKLAWMPFSAGNRKCVGAEFAMMEAGLIITRLFQTFKISQLRSVKSKISTTHQTQSLYVHLQRRLHS